MTCIIAALSFGGEWIIHDKDSIKTSFQTFKNYTEIELIYEKKENILKIAIDSPVIAVLELWPKQYQNIII